MNERIKSPPNWLVCVLLVLAITAAYWPVSGYAFIHYDDDVYTWKNPHVSNGLSWSGLVWAFTHFTTANWHPLTWLSHMLDVQLYGLNAGRHHVTNVLIHAANTILLFLWLGYLTGARWRSAMVAALFALHPLHVESVAWISERKDVLSTFFLLLSFLSYTRYVKCKLLQNARGKTLYYWLTLGSFTLGLMSKPMLVTLPFLLLLLDFWPLGIIQNIKFKIQNFKPLLVEKIPFFVLAAAACIITYLAQQKDSAVMSIIDLPLGIRVENALIAYVDYLKKMIWPDALALFYPLFDQIDTQKVVVPIMVLLLLSVGVLFFRRQMPYLVTGWLWYLGTLVPVIGLVQVGGQSMADRYTYVPLIGVFIAIVWLVTDISVKWPYRTQLLTIVSLGVLSPCWCLTARQVRYWENSETLARHALAVTEYNAPMQMLLGKALIEQNKSEEAAEHFKEALRIWPDDVQIQCNLALTWLNRGNLDHAVEICQSALKMQPHEPKAHYLLATALMRQGKLSEAITEYKAVLAVVPDQVYAMNDLAWLLATAPEAGLRNGREAVKLAQDACQISDYQTALYVGTLAAAYAEAGQFDDALVAVQKACDLAEKTGQTDLLKRNRQLMELYRAHQPVRE
jgi:Flp pilus assembly protein TadD